MPACLCKIPLPNLQKVIFRKSSANKQHTQHNGLPLLLLSSYILASLRNYFQRSNNALTDSNGLILLRFSLFQNLVPFFYPFGLLMCFFP